MKFFDFQDNDFREAFVEESVIADVQYEICRLMKEGGVSRAELARRLAVSAPYVTQLLNDDANLTLRTVARVFDALGDAVVICAKSSMKRVDSTSRAAQVGIDKHDWSKIVIQDVWNVANESLDEPRPRGGAAVVWFEAFKKKAA